MFGGLVKLHRPEYEVVLVARGEHGSAMQQRGGVLLRGPWGEADVSPTVTDSAEEIRGSDFVLITVKSHHTDEMLRAAGEHLGSAVLVSIQNGINLPALRKHVPEERLVLGLTATNMTVSAPGEVTLQRNDATVIGPSRADQDLDSVLAAKELLKTSGLEIVVNRDILGAQYNKLVFNTLAAASSLSDLDFVGEAILHGPWRRSVAIPLQRESLRVIEQSRIPLVRTPGAADAVRFGRLLRNLERPVIGRVIGSVMRKFFNRKPLVFSLQSDLRRGRPTEVDFINGEIVRLAEENGLKAPLNAKVVDLVHQLERRGGFFSRDEVVEQMAACDHHV